MNETKSNYISALDAFYARENEQGTDTCFVQPMADGSLIELTWSDVGDRARRMAAYLRSLDLDPGSRIALMSNNCAYWIIADLAIWLAGHVSVPIYPVLTGGSVRQILGHCGARLMFAGKLDNWDDISRGVPKELQLVTFPVESSVPDGAGITWEQIMQRFQPISDRPRRLLEDTATIIYTSGTTGMPKGVMHSFENLAIVATQSGDFYSITSRDRKLSYLPLAHVAERAAIELNQLYHGFTVYFSASLHTFGEDLRRARPTMFFAVPRIWQKFQQQVFAHFPERRLAVLKKIPLVSQWICRKVLSGLGLDQVRVAVSGSAPLSTSLIEWYGTLGLEILEGYGMSENFAYSHATRPGESRVGYVGTPLPGVSCKLADSGEIMVKTPAATTGYYRESGLTADLFDSDGYLHTGDTGEIDARGRLKITGRIKEIFKTSKGKYVSPAPIEDFLLASTTLETVCVTGTNLSQAVALAVLSEEAARRARASKEQKNAITRELQNLLSGTNARLDKHENLACLVVVNEQWRVDNGMLTPTLKVKRDRVDQLYESSFAHWLEQSAQVVWASPCL